MDINQQDRMTLLADYEALRCRPSRRDGVRRHRCNSGKTKTRGAVVQRCRDAMATGVLLVLLL